MLARTCMRYNERYRPIFPNRRMDVLSAMQESRDEGDCVKYPIDAFDLQPLGLVTEIMKCYSLLYFVYDTNSVRY